MFALTNQPHDPFAALRFRNFRLFIFARLFATFGFNFQAVCVGWQVYSITHDALSLGLIGLAEAIPFIITSFFAGAVADTYSRKYIILIALLGYVLSALGLLYTALHLTEMISSGSATWIYSIIFLTGITRGFLSPAMFAFMSQIVPREHYASSSTWNSTVWQVGAVSGPAVGGLIYGFFGATEAYATNVICLFLAFLFFFLIPNQAVNRPEQKEKLTERLTAGIKFVFANQVMLGALSLDLFAVLFGGAVALLPIFATDILHTGAEGLGLLRSAPALGAVVMAIVLAYKPIKNNAGVYLLWAVALFGLCTILFAFSTWFWISFTLLAFTGAFDNISVVVRQTIVQLMTPDHMRGRVSAVNSIFIGSSNEIGSFESGVAAKFLGLIPSVVFGGSMTLLVVGITSRWAPKLRAMKLA